MKILRSALPARLLTLVGVAVAACAPAVVIGQAAAVAPTVSLAFTPATIASGATSVLTITLGNGNTTAAVLNAALTDVLPTGLTVANATIGGSCTTASVGAKTGSTTITYAAQASIPAGGCAITVNVTGKAAGQVTYFTDTIGAGALQTSLGNNAAAASARLAVQAAGTVPATVGLTQANATQQMTAAGFAVAVTQTYSTTVPVGIVVSTNPAAGTALAQGSTVTLLVSRGPGAAATTASISSAPGLTPEQVSVARGLERTCDALAGAQLSGVALTSKQADLLNKCTAIIGDYANGTGVGTLRNTLDAISGRQATAAARAPLQFSSGQIANIGGRLAAIRAGEQGGVNLSGLGMGLPGAAQTVLDALWDAGRELLGGPALGGSAGEDSGDLLGKRLGVFATGTIRRGSESTTDAEEGFDLRDTGVTVGADYRLGSALVLGVAGGYGTTRILYDDAGSRLDAKHWTSGLYGSYFTDLFHIDWLASYGHHADDLNRQIDYSSSSVSVGCNGVTCSDQATGSTGARVLTLDTSGGMDFHRSAFEFGPTLELEYEQVRVSSFAESSGSGLALNLEGMTTPSLVSKFGGYASYAWKTPWAVILPQVRVRYLHEFMNDARSESVMFAADTLPGAAGRAFQIFTDRPDRNYFDWKASLLFQFPYGIAGYIDYGGLAGLSNISTHELNVGLRMELGH